MITVSALLSRKAASSEEPERTGRWACAAPPVAAAARSDAQEPVRLATRTPAAMPTASRPDGAAEGLALISAWLADHDAAGIAALCVEWSATPGDEPALDRDWARQAWQLRLGLDARGRERFDALPPALRRQLAEVHREVFSAGVRQAG